MNLLDEMFYDNFYRRIADCMDEKQLDKEESFAKQLEEQLLQETDINKRNRSLEYIDVCRRIQMRAAGKSYVAGFIMGLSAGAALKKDE